MTDTTYNLSISSNMDGKGSMNTSVSTNDVDELRRILQLRGITAVDAEMGEATTCATCGACPCQCATSTCSVCKCDPCQCSDVQSGQQALEIPTIPVMEDLEDDDFFDPEDPMFDDEEDFADPGGKSALRAASDTNPRIHACPTCGAANRLTARDVALGYQCDACADAAEGGGMFEGDALRLAGDAIDYKKYSRARGKMDEELEPWMGRDLDEPAYQRQAKYNDAMRDELGGPALRREPDNLDEENCMECGGLMMEGTCMECGNTLDETYDYGHTMARLRRYQEPSSLKPVKPDQAFGKQADNTWKDDPNDALDHLTEAYARFLAEADQPDDNDGTLSPLTSDSRNEFNKDPFSGEEAVTDGSRSPLSSIKRQNVYK